MQWNGFPMDGSSSKMPSYLKRRATDPTLIADPVCRSKFGLAADIIEILFMLAPSAKENLPTGLTFFEHSNISQSTPLVVRGSRASGRRYLRRQ